MSSVPVPTGALSSAQMDLNAMKQALLTSMKKKPLKSPPVQQSPKKFDMALYHAVLDLRALGYTFDRIVEEAEVAKDFLLDCYKHWQFPLPRPQAFVSNDASRNATPQPSQLQRPMHNTYNRNVTGPSRVHYVLSPPWLQDHVINISDSEDEADDDNENDDDDCRETSIPNMNVPKRVCSIDESSNKRRKCSDGKLSDHLPVIQPEDGTSDNPAMAHDLEELSKQIEEDEKEVFELQEEIKNLEKRILMKKKAILQRKSTKIKLLKKEAPQTTRSANDKLKNSLRIEPTSGSQSNTSSNISTEKSTEGHKTVIAEEESEDDALRLKVIRTKFRQLA